MKRNRYTAIDLFAGAGGMTEGFRWAGYDVVASLEWDHNACETHRFNHPDTVIIEGDITKESTKTRLHKAAGKTAINVVVGGPPCQGFSLMGTRLGTNKKLGRFIDDPRNLLYKEFVDIVKYHKPQVFVMENVPGLFSYKEGAVKEQIISDFSNLKYKGEKLGYKVDVKVLTAADYGVPQLRQRVIFIGNRIGVKNVFPEPDFYNPAILEQWKRDAPLFSDFSVPVECKGKKEYRTLDDAISDLPFLKAGGGTDSRVEYSGPPRNEYQILMHQTYKVIPHYRELIRRNEILPEGVYNHQCRTHNELDIKRYAALPQGGIFTDLPSELRNGVMPENFQDSYRKMDPRKPSYTIVAHLYKDGNAFVHPDSSQARTFTVREAARIQSFPDDFVFCTSRTSQFKQVGNAVPPLLAYHIGLAVKKMLADV